MSRALKDTAILWTSLLILGGLALSRAAHPASPRLAVAEHRQKAFLAQVKGLSDLLSDRLRPPLNLSHEMFRLNWPMSTPSASTSSSNRGGPAKRRLGRANGNGRRLSLCARVSLEEDIEIHKSAATSRIAAMSRPALPGTSTTTSWPWPSSTTWADRPPQQPRQPGRAPQATPANTPRPTTTTTSPASSRPSSAATADASATTGCGTNPTSTRNGAPIPSVRKIMSSYSRLAQPPPPPIECASWPARSPPPSTFSPARRRPPTASATWSSCSACNRDAGAAPYFDIDRRPGLWLVEQADGPPHAPRVLNISHHLFLRDLMVESSDTHKPIWISR